jgi:hypothetical protein
VRTVAVTAGFAQWECAHACLGATLFDTDSRYAETAVERELVLRLASLLWRLRRIIAIETDLFQIQAEILRNRRNEGL